MNEEKIKELLKEVSLQTGPSGATPLRAMKKLYKAVKECK